MRCGRLCCLIASVVIIPTLHFLLQNPCIGLSISVTFCSGLAPPIKCLRIVLSRSPAIVIAKTKIVFGGCISARGQLLPKRESAIMIVCFCSIHQGKAKDSILVIVAFAISYNLIVKCFCLIIVCDDALALGIHICKTRLGLDISLCSSFLKPLSGKSLIDGSAVTVSIADGKILLCKFLALFCRHRKPAECFVIILRYAITCGIAYTKSTLCFSKSFIGGFFIKLNCTGFVLRYSISTIKVYSCQIAHRLKVTSGAGFFPILYGSGGVPKDHFMESHQCLRNRMSTIGSILEPSVGLFMIFFHSDAVPIRFINMILSLNVALTGTLKIEFKCLLGIDIR